MTPILALFLLAPPASPVRVSLPGADWAVQVDTELKVEANGPKGDGRMYLFGTTPDGTGVSVTLERVEQQATTQGCQSARADRSKSVQADLKAVAAKEWQQDGAVMFEYVVPEFQGQRLDQKNVFACMGRGNVYVDVHLTRTNFQPSDQARLDAVLKSVHVAESSSFDLLRQGSVLYARNQYKEAIAPYRKALELEKRERKLEKRYWYVLVDNLTIAYGISGDAKSSEETAQYGLSVDPDYPIFHYNLACAAAERGDVEATTRFLTAAYRLKKNTLPGEKMPDARTDNSFQALMRKDKQFKAFVEGLK